MNVLSTERSGLNLVPRLLKLFKRDAIASQVRQTLLQTLVGHSLANNNECRAISSLLHAKVVISAHKRITTVARRNHEDAPIGKVLDGVSATQACTCTVAGLNDEASSLISSTTNVQCHKKFSL
ncbi:hypothetical protein B9Z48_11600 [Limnohabitans sp. WS1]|nr:hypothetical protein B9Z48_11600 [Limnohabitans sp. WS1]